MIRQLAIAAVSALALGGCASDYAYRSGAGDYYYGRPSVQYYDDGYGYGGYGAPYGSLYGYPGGWTGGISIGYGGGYYGGYGSPYGSPYYGGYGGYGGYYPYYPPYYWHRYHNRPKPPKPDQDGPRTGGRLPPVQMTGPQRENVYVQPGNGSQPLVRMPRPGYGTERPDRPWQGREDRGGPVMSRPMPMERRNQSEVGSDGGARAVPMAPPPRMQRPAPAERASPPPAPVFRERERTREETP